MSRTEDAESWADGTLSADFIVVGSGVAGLWAALHLADRGSVALLTKSTLIESNTQYAQGGVAVAVSPEDRPELHYADTMAAGAGLCDAPAVRVLTEEGPDQVRRLIAMGARFDTADGELVMGREAAHSRRRILHALGDATGREIETCLAGRVRESPEIHIHERTFARDALLCGGRCVGVAAYGPAGEQLLFRAKATALATGGLGQLFGVTTNPLVATGDGLAVAFRAGAALRDLEFVQFHPTALVDSGFPRFLISEATRGEGAVLLNSAGERFMPRYHPDAELAPRDVVCRAILQEMAALGSDRVYLDLRAAAPGHLAQRFPTIAATCRERGVDITSEPVPVAPAAHYYMGGIGTDLHGRATVPGLYACGECASVGLHGANRLASNSMLEGVVFGPRCAEAMAADSAESRRRDGSPAEALRLVTGPGSHAVGDPQVRRELRELAWAELGILRSGAGLTAARQRMRELLRRGTAAAASEAPDRDDPFGYETANMLLLGELIAAAAAARTESRGAHYRTDYPHATNGWLKHLVLWRSFDQGVRLTHAAVR